MDNPTFDPPTAYEDLGALPPSTSRVVVPFERPPKQRIPAKTERLIGELGLRYRPSAQADLEEHAAALALLTRDVASVPPDLLERAINRWVRNEKFMPRAAELISTARYLLQNGDGVGDPNSRENAEKLAAKYNARLAAEGKSIRWAVDEQNNLALGSAA